MINKKAMSSSEMAGKVALFIILGILLGAALVAGLAIVLMWAWGLFAASVLGLPLLSFHEAVGGIMLLFVVRFMFIGPRGKK